MVSVDLVIDFKLILKKQKQSFEGYVKQAFLNFSHYSQENTRV